jgi:hypothetical protein
MLLELCVVYAYCTSVCVCFYSTFHRFVPWHTPLFFCGEISFGHLLPEQPSFVTTKHLFWLVSMNDGPLLKFSSKLLSLLCLERKQLSRIGGSPLYDVVSSFLCHTHTDGKYKLLEWPDRSCLLLYINARIN